MSHSDYLRDAISLAFERHGHTAIGRRQLLAALGALGVTATLPSSAEAQARRVVVCNWGGDAQRHQPTAWGAPFEKQTGIKVEFDGSGPSFGKIRTMVESRNVVWDVCDANLAAAMNLGRRGYLETMDWTKVDRNKVRAGFYNDWGVSHFLYSFVLTYDKRRFGNNPPKSWADFWNVKDFPGTRTLPDRILGALEGALMAGGSPADASKIYPVNEQAALEKIREIKEKTVFWKTGAESQQLMRQGEVTMGMIWHTRSVVLRRERNSRIDFTWNQGILIPAGWLVPKGNPAGSAAFDFIASTQSPESQVELLRLMGNGPANPAASPLVPADLKADNPTDDANFAVQVLANPEWHADNQDRVYNDYIKVIAG